MPNPSGIIRSGLYIFEGIDNVGKTTIIQKLKEKIEKNGSIECITVAFPGNEPNTLGSLVYDVHHHQDKYFNSPINATSLQMLHIASHIDLIQRKLLELSRSEKVVLLDRFWWSTYAYGLGMGLNKEVIQAILAPELLYWREIDIERIFLIERKERIYDYETETDKEIIRQYRELAEQEQKCRLIDNDGSLQKVIDKIYTDSFGE